MPSRTSLDEVAQSQPQSQADSTLAQLNDPKFDPVSFLNEILPSVSLTSQSTTTQKNSRTSQIQSTALEVQTLFSKINTHNLRSSSELTTLTDEILRSGNRLAYGVEILRGNVNSLHDLLTDTLKAEIAQFVQDEVLVANGNKEPDKVVENEPSTNAKSNPEFITQLRMLGTVKARLESVVTVFGEAMKWPLPPSELSMATSLVSVSAPELGIQSSDEDDKAREIAKTIRGEITDLLDSGGGGFAGLQAASKRVEDYRLLATIWKGTAEEKARNRFVDGLVKIVEDRKKVLEARTVSQRIGVDGGPRPSSTAPGLTSRDSGSASGFFRNLTRFKDDLYLE